jgi:integrase
LRTPQRHNQGRRRSAHDADCSRRFSSARCTPVDSGAHAPAPARDAGVAIDARGATALDDEQARRTRLLLSSHQLRQAHEVEMAHEGVPLIVIQRQLGHSNFGVTWIYLQGIDNAEIIDTVHRRRAPIVPVSASLRL